jgi:Arc/MetJ-type ribon-helix-helix transcriptional regulator
MPTHNVVLTAHQASLVKQLVTSGCYQNANEVLREGLRTQTAHILASMCSRWRCFIRSANSL